ncbi:MAG: STAS domain-containing protein [bacterium]|nr:STAS domain-containing protein [bacterium]
MEIVTSEQGSVAVIEVKGRVDSLNAHQFGEALSGPLSGGFRNLVLDLVQVDYMSSAGLRELVAAYKKANKNAGDLRLVQPSERVQEILEIAGLDTVFRVYPSQVDAVGSF